MISVDYRLAPEHKFPAAAEDAYAALVDIHARAEELRFDAKSHRGGGDSAGGNLSAVVAIMCRDRGGPSACDTGADVSGDDYSFDTGSYRDNAEGYPADAGHHAVVLGQYLADEADGANPIASPLARGDVSGVAPAYSITAEFDPLRDEGDAYAAGSRRQACRDAQSATPE